MKLFLSIFAAILMFLPVYSQDDEAEEIIAKIVANHAKDVDIDKITSWRVEGTMMVPMMQIEASMDMMFKKPNKYRSERTINSTLQKYIATYNGNEGWSYNQMKGDKAPEKMDNEEVAKFIENDILKSDFDNYKEKGTKIIYLTDDQVGDVDVYKLKVIEKDDEKIIYVDQKENVVIKSDVMLDLGAPQKIPGEVFLKNYSRENGIMVPHAVEVHVQGQTFQIMIYEKFEFNIDLDDSLFEKPKVD